jgi:hypothetical protein
MCGEKTTQQLSLWVSNDRENKIASQLLGIKRKEFIGRKDSDRSKTPL